MTEGAPARIQNIPRDVPSRSEGRHGDVPSRSEGRHLRKGRSVKMRVQGRFPGATATAAALLTALLVAGAGEARAQGGFGTIKGRLVWEGGSVPPAKNLVEQGAAPKDPEVCGK